MDKEDRIHTKRVWLKKWIEQKYRNNYLQNFHSSKVSPTLVLSHFEENTDTQTIVNRVHEDNRRYFVTDIVPTDDMGGKGGILNLLNDNNISAYGYGLCNNNQYPEPMDAEHFNFNSGCKNYEIKFNG